LDPPRRGRASRTARPRAGRRQPLPATSPPGARPRAAHRWSVRDRREDPRLALSAWPRARVEDKAGLLALRHLEADLLAFQLGAVEELDRALGLVGVDLDEGEAVEDADVVDGVVGEDGALAEGPAQVLLVDAAALATIDEELGGLRLVAVVG